MVEAASGDLSAISKSAGEHLKRYQRSIKKKYQRANNPSEITLYQFDTN